MIRSRPGRLIAAVVVAVLGSVGACSGGTVQISGELPRLTVFAAASLRDALTEIGAAYGAGDRGPPPLFSFEASSTLAAQIRAGARADLFFAADTATTELLTQEGLGIGEPQVIASGSITLVVPMEPEGPVRTWHDLARPGVRIIAAGEHVPVARYARETLGRLAEEPGAPPGFLDAVQRNVVSREDNVRAVLAKVELGEGDVALVYLTDARSSGAVRTLDLPASAHVSVEYSALVPREGGAREEADKFLAFVAGPEGQRILRGHGFTPP